MDLLLVIISFGLGILAILYIRQYDLYEKEPITVMVATTFFGGVVSTRPTTGIDSAAYLLIALHAARWCSGIHAPLLLLRS